jgi:hypothetical protein
VIELARYRGLALAVLALGLALGLVDLGLTAGVGPTSRWLPHGEYPVDRSMITFAGRRLVGVDRDLRRTGTEPSTGLGLLLGQSTLECGVDAAVLEADDGTALRWLNLFGEGGSIHKIDELAALVFAGGIRPAVVVLAINPYMLVGNQFTTIRAAELRATNNRIKPWVWTWDNRVLINHLALMAVDEVRARVFGAFGLGLASLFTPHPRPWEVPEVKVTTHKTAPELESRLEYNRRIGWLDPKRYAPTGSNAAALAGLIRRFHAVGSEVVIVEMPLRGPFRAALPPEARACIAAVARDADPGRPAPIIDLEDKVPDALFLDLDHLDVEGRAVCSRVLAARIRDLLAPATAARLAR